jgi:glycosyltransferase involved in cell wall biosynthesis
VIATDVGSLREDIAEGVTGLLCAPHDPAALAGAIERYFDGDLYHSLDENRHLIRARGLERHSWENVGRILRPVYEAALRG